MGEWIEHRRSEDGELLGWIAPEGDDFVVFDLLGRQRSDPVDWLSAEEVLEALGLGYLAEPHELRLADGSWLRVRIVEVSTRAVRVKKDDWGNIDVPLREFIVDFPVSDEALRLVRPARRE